METLFFSLGKSEITHFRGPICPDTACLSDEAALYTPATDLLCSTRL